MRSRWPISLIALVLGYGFVLSISAAMKPASALMMEEAKETRRAVLKRVPLGSSSDTARAVMSAQGFSCNQMENKPFTVSEPDSSAVVTHPPVDFLWCDSGKLGIALTKRWQVMFVNHGGPVSSIAVSVDLGGP